ncbi:uncharacterized protein LOC108863749 [Galendromus occidentalis]|uniref:Uncharacterized protein LOC108863749 n=1 Tax=Galendromus occidentalis TaxID=34638 RepID=A0AAJ7L4M4_9ACAR|nr:uncharacterized protein LOC108863749 [Galendromus occidentalis]
MAALFIQSSRRMELILMLIFLEYDSVSARGSYPRNYMQACEGGLGVCTTAAQCRKHAGEVVGTCPLSTCCRMSRTCDQIILQNNTYFVENPLEMRGKCDVDVHKLRYPGDICQLKLDLVEFSTIGPDPNGICSFDSFEVSGQLNAVPVICGLNSGQHFYLDVQGIPTVHLRMNLAANQTRRVWKIRVSQLPCRSGRLAPRGCLQYLEENSGIISSFNYGNPFNSSYPVISPSYEICFRDKCQLNLSKAGPFGLTAQPQTSSVTIRSLNRLNLDANCLDPQDLAWLKQKSFISVDYTRFCGDNFPDLYTSVHMVNQMSVAIYPLEYNRSEVFYPGFRLRYMLNCGRAAHEQTALVQLKAQGNAGEEEDSTEQITTTVDSNSSSTATSEPLLVFRAFQSLKDLHSRR